MAKLDDVVVGLQGFIDYQQSLCNHNMTGAYRSSHGYLLQYWIGINEALDAPSHMYILWDCQCKSSNHVVESKWTHIIFWILANFARNTNWTTNMWGPLTFILHLLSALPTMCMKDISFYFYPKNKDIDKPIGVCRVLFPPNLSVVGEHPHQILVQWFIPISMIIAKTMLLVNISNFLKSGKNCILTFSIAHWGT